jgi:ATP-binding cassette, subfamily B, multidrug efflux pump
MMRSRIRPVAGGILLGFVCLAATNALSLAIPWLIKAAIDALRSLEAGVAHRLVVRYALMIIGFAVLQALIRTWSRVLIFNAGRNIEYGLRRDLFAHLGRMDAGFFRRHPTGDVMSRMTNDLSAVRMMFGPGLLNLFNTAFVYVTTVVLLLRLSPALTLWALLPYPVILVGARFATRKMYKASRAIADQLGVMSSAIQEDLAGMAVIKHYTLEPSRQAAFAAINDEYLVRSLSLVRARGALMPLFAMLGGVGTLIVLWAGGREVIAGRLTVGGLVAFNAYLVLLSWPTVALGWIIGIWQRGVASWTRVRELLSSAPAISDDAVATNGAASATAPEGTAPAIEVRELEVAVDGRKLLDRVSFSLPAWSTPWCACRWSPPGPSGWTGGTSRRFRCAGCGASSATPPRTPSCSRRRWPRTSGSESVQTRPRRGPPSPSASGGPRRRPGWPPTSRCSPTATTRWSASAGSPCRAGSGSGWRWPAPWPPIRAS